MAFKSFLDTIKSSAINAISPTFGPAINGFTSAAKAIVRPPVSPAPIMSPAPIQSIAPAPVQSIAPAPVSRPITTPSAQIAPAPAPAPSVPSNPVTGPLGKASGDVLAGYTPPPPVVPPPTEGNTGNYQANGTDQTESGFKNLLPDPSANTATYTAPDTKNYDTQIQGLIGEEGTKKLDAQINDEIARENARIDAATELKKADARRQAESSVQEQFSQLAGVGFNPLSSGGNSVRNANTEMLNRFISQIDAEANAEKASRASTIRGDKTNAFKSTLDNLKSERERLTDEANNAFVRDRTKVNDTYQNVLSVLNIQKTKRDLSQSEKTEQFSNIKELLGLYGSAVFSNISEADLRALEASSGLPAGSLNKNSKTLKELEAAAKNSLTEVSPGATLYDPITGKSVFTAPQKESSNGLSQAQMNTTANSIITAFNNSPVTKNFNTVKQGYEYAKSLANKANPTSTDDQGLIYAFAKAQDPESVVREGEYQTVQKYSQSLIQQKWADAKRIAQNQPFLTPEARANMISTINSKYQAASNAYKSFESESNRQLEGVYSGAQRSLTNYDGYGETDNTQQVQSAYESAGLDVPYDQAVQQYGVDGVRKILEGSGISFNKPLSTGVNGSAEKIAAAIKHVESGGNYSIKGASGESGAYQFMPSTWKAWAGQYLGNANAPQTPANQDKVALAKVSDLLKQGYSPQQIALIWNGGQPVVKKGVNKYGVAYDSGAYANKVLNALRTV